MTTPTDTIAAVRRVLEADDLTQLQKLVAVGIAVHGRPPKPETAEITDAIRDLKAKCVITNRIEDGSKRLFLYRGDALKPTTPKKITTTITIVTTEE